MKKNNKLLAFICAAATAASGLTLSMVSTFTAIITPDETELTIR